MSDTVFSFDFFNIFERLISVQKQTYDSIANLYAVDGTIIGTGQADYTKDSTEYVLNNKGKKFCLIDVPGIEGNEKKYEKIIQKSLDKSHIIIYVSGTNKKIEPKTINKIKKYLKNDTEVYLICNVHCMPKLKRNPTIDGTYSSELKEVYNSAQSSVFKQSEKELKELLGNNYKAGFLINGLEGLCSSALCNGISTLITDINSKQLRSYQEKFFNEYNNDISLMMTDSHLQELRNIPDNYIKNYKEYINLANTKKFMACLNDASQKIQVMKKHTEETIRVIIENYDMLITSCEDIKNEIERNINFVIQESVQNVIEKLLNEYCNIIEQKHGKLKQKDIDMFFYGKQESLEYLIRFELINNCRYILQQSESQIKEAVDRFSKDISFSTKLIINSNDLINNEEIEEIIRGIIEALNYNLKDFGKDFFNIAFLAFDGAMVGAFGGVIGAVIGGIIGGLIGIGSAILKYFQTKEKRIANAKKNAEAKMYELSDLITEKLENNINLDEITKENIIQIDNIISKCTKQKNHLKKIIYKLTKVFNYIETIKISYIGAKNGNF